MKRTIRLNERDLHSIISESVRRTINEMWDDEFDSEQMEMYRQSIEADHIAKDVENGVYDDQLDQILNNGACDYFGLDTDLLEDEWITDAAVERKCVIDKDFALKYGHNPGNPNFGSDAHPSHASYMERYQGNENRFDWPSYQPALSDDYWKDAASRDLGQKLPNTFTKKGEFRKVKDLPSRFAKDLYGTDQADKRPLHRKGSLNRVGMPESRMRNIVRESVNKVLSEMSLHKGSSVHRHSSGNWAPSGEGWKWKYDGDRVDRYLWRMKKDAEKAGCVGPHKFPMAKWFGDNAYNYFNYISEYGGDLEHVPCITNEEDDYEMSPEDLYRAIDELCYGNEIGYDNMRTFG